MGKIRAFFSLLYHGLVYFAVPSVIFYWLTLSSPFPMFPIKITLLNYYIQEIIIGLYSFSIREITIPIGFRITITSILGLFVTIFAMLGCLLEDVSTLGSIKVKQNKFLGFIKNLIIMVWVWFYFHQFSTFIVDLNGFQSTLLLQWQFYLGAGILVSFLTAIANLLQATDIENNEVAISKNSDENKGDKIVIGKK